MAACRYCKADPCPNDCEELQLIYREEQREKLKDIEVSDEEAWEYNRLHPDYLEACEDDF